MNTRTVELNQAAIEYLRSAEWLDRDILERLRAPPHQDWTYKFDEALCERIRGALTIRLAQVGFDEKYQLTSDGKLIEDLIDRLFGDA